MNHALSLVTASASAERSARLDTHSPLPWKTCRMSGVMRIENVARLQHVAVLPNTGPNTFKDAEAIVKAVNHHDALVDVLEEVVEEFHDQDEPLTAKQEAVLARSIQILRHLHSV